MKKNLIVSFALFLGLVVLVSSSKGQVIIKDTKGPGKIMTINISDEDTIVNGKKFNQLSKADKEQFRKMEKERKGSELKRNRNMKDLDKDMQVLNKKMLIIEDGDINTIDINGDEPKVIIRKSIAPKAPRSPRSPEPNVMIAPDPEFPGNDAFEMNMAPGVFKFHINEDRDEDAQVFTFNDGDHSTVVKLMQANAEDLKKIGITNKDEIKMYPNPAKNQLTLSFNFSNSAPVKITIYGEEGKQIKTETIADYKAGDYEKTYTLSEFNNGTYLVEFAQGTNKVVRKLYLDK